MREECRRFGIGDNTRSQHDIAQCIVHQPDLALVFGLEQILPRFRGLGNDLRVVHHRERTPCERNTVKRAVHVDVRIVQEQRHHVLEVRNQRNIDRCDEVGPHQQRHITHVGGDDVDVADATGAELGDNLVVVADVRGRKLDTFTVHEVIDEQGLVVALPTKKHDIVGKGAAAPEAHGRGCSGGGHESSVEPAPCYRHDGTYTNQS